MGIVDHLIGLGVTVFALVSDQFQLSLMKKISILPEIVGYQGNIDEQTVEQMRKMSKKEEQKSTPEESPFYFLSSGEPQTSLDATLKNLNFSQKFVNSFRSLLVNEKPK